MYSELDRHQESQEAITYLLNKCEFVQQGQNGQKVSDFIKYFLVSKLLRRDDSVCADWEIQGPINRVPGAATARLARPNSGPVSRRTHCAAGLLLQARNYLERE